jgi:hypothetical protein
MHYFVLQLLDIKSILYPLLAKKLFKYVNFPSVIPWLFSLAKVIRDSLWLEQASFIANLRKYNAN